MKTVLAFILFVLTAYPAFCQNTDQSTDEHFQNLLKSSTHPPTIAYDKFKNLTTIDCDAPTSIPTTWTYNNSPLPVTLVWDIDVAGLINGKSPKGEVVFEVILTSSTEQWKYLDCHDFHWLVDGKPFKYKKEKYENQVGNGAVFEYFEIFLTKKQFSQLAKGKSIEFETCGDQSSITGDALFPFWAVNQKYKEFLGQP